MADVADRGIAMGLDDATAALIGHIYADTCGGAPWNRVIEALMQRTGSRFAMVSIVDVQQGEYLSRQLVGPDDARFLDGMRDYAHDLYRDDPTLAYGRRYPEAGHVTLSTAMAASDPASSDGVADRHLHYKRWTADALGVGESDIRYSVPSDDLLFGVSLHPPVARGAHDPRDLRLFAMLFGHMERAVRLALRPPDFQSVDEARLLVDRRGHVHAVSPAARRLIAMADGLAITGRRLRAARRGESVRLDAAIVAARDALSHGTRGGAVAVTRPSGRAAFLVTVAALPMPTGVFAALGPAATIRIVDPAAALTAAGSWAGLFGFTPAETRLATTLLDGEGNLRDAADRLGIAYATARVHIRSLFDKAGVRSQMELARLLTRLGGMIGLLTTGGLLTKGLAAAELLA